MIVVHSARVMCVTVVSCGRFDLMSRDIHDYHLVGLQDTSKRINTAGCFYLHAAL